MARADQDGPAGTGRGRWLVLGVSSFGVFLAFLDVTIVNVAFPSLEESFPGSGRASLSWVLNAYNVVFAALLVPSGRLADRFGRKRVYLAGLALFVLASALCAAAPSPATLIAARVLQAVGAALLIPASLALILPEFAVGERATAVALFGAAAALASGIGPSVGGLLVDLSDWRLVFLVNVPLGVGALLWARGVLRESRDAAAEGLPDPVGIVLVALGVGALALGIVQGEEWGWGSAAVLSAFAAAAVLGGLFVLRSMRHPRPAIELALFRQRRFSAANGGTVLFAMAFYGAIVANVLFLTSVWGYSVLTAGLAITPAPLASAAVAGPAGRLADRVGQRIVVVSGCIVYALAMVWFVTRVGAGPSYAAEWLPGALLTGIGIGFAFPALTSASVDALPAARFATGSAVNSTARQLGAVLGVALLVAIVGTPSPLEAPDAFDRAWGFSALGALAAGVAALAIGGVRVPAVASPVAHSPGAAGRSPLER